MRKFVHYLFITVIALSLVSFNVDARPRKTIELPEKVISRTESKVEEITKKIQKEIVLTDKQVSKVKAIKLQEAQSIEVQRLEPQKSQHEIKNEIILIKSDAEKKISKVLKKNQRVLWEVKKDHYEYSPGLIENLKDVFKNTKENIQEKLK